MRLTRAELEAYRGATLPDLIGPGTRLLFVGINPGLRTAAVQAHFGKRGNRFYPALYGAGIVDRVIDANDGYAAADVEHLKSRGVGITNLVPVATARADELTVDELREGAAVLEAKVRALNPGAVAILGVTAYRAAFGRPRAVVGRQDDDLGGRPLWVVPNPSGLNAHDTVDTLAAAYREVAVAAGIDVYAKG